MWHVWEKIKYIQDIGWWELEGTRPLETPLDSSILLKRILYDKIAWVWIRLIWLRQEQEVSCCYNG
jgi:hypothetical protein